MGFFDVADDRGRPSGQAPRRPSWSRVPHEELPVPLPLADVVAVGVDVAVVVSGFEVYATGFTFTLRGVRHPEAPGHDDDLHADMAGVPGSSSARRLRIGLRYADGRIATSDGAPHSAEDRGRAVVLRSLGGSGSADATEQRYWAWPIPQNGDVELIAVWPARGIPETTLLLSGAALRDAARGVQPVWPGTPTP